MTTRTKRLELTWIGKDDRPRLEPRILLEDPELSYRAAKRVSDDDIFDNRLIHGDNLLALKALEQEFAGKVKCVYIDPPFNTGQAFEHYEDGLEHSLWLSLMRDRVEMLYRLLSADGTLFVHIDDNELAYLTVLLDEVFGRKNRTSMVTFKQGAATGHKSINPGCVSTANYILIYAKDKVQWRPNRLFTERGRDDRYNQFIPNVHEHHGAWTFLPLAKAYAQYSSLSEKEARARIRSSPEEIDEFVAAHAAHVVRLARPDYKAISKEARSLANESKERPDEVLHLPREDHKDFYFLRGERVLFYMDKLKDIDGHMVAGEPLTTIWDDLLSNNLHNEGDVDFPKGKKPESLIKRVIEMSTNPGDWVLDSFGGSGTTGAVAHKMRRRWILVELGEHCQTHCLPRLSAVVDGTDASGVTEAADWHGGGGFHYFKLASSLLEKDKWGNWVVSKQYNPEMLAEAMCKLEGFHYAPDAASFWNHGKSTESDFIYVTTQNLSRDQLQFISEQVGSERTLLICCAAFRGKADFPNLTVKKIPQAVLARCEWGRDDYSLNVQEQAPLVAVDDAKADVREGAGSSGHAAKTTVRGRRRKPASMQEMPLFAGLGGGSKGK